MAAVIALFSSDILRLWTGSAVTAQNAAPIVSVLVLGTALNGLMNLPYALQLACGWTSLGLRINIFLIATMVPAIFFMASRYGPIGAAAVWVALNSIYMLIGVPLTHHRLLKGEAGRWFIEDFGLPLLGVAIVAGGVRWLITSPLPTPLAIAYLPGIFIGTLSIAILTASQIRAWIWDQISGVILHHA
jgi:O-antigen/teichoic acid export membrane protein